MNGLTTYELKGRRGKWMWRTVVEQSRKKDFYAITLCVFNHFIGWALRERENGEQNSNNNEMAIQCALNA